MKKTNVNIPAVWLKSIELILKKPIVLAPFLVIGFLEALAAELLYFSSQKPLAIITGPIIRKFFGEKFLHYPLDLILFPKTFYSAQLVIYVFIGIFLTGLCVNIVRNIKENLPVKRNALVKNALKRYFAFFVFGVIMAIITILLKNLGTIGFSFFLRVGAKHLPGVIFKIAPMGFSFGMYFLHVAIQVFFVLTVVIMVLKQKPLLKALLESIVLGARNYLNIFTMILVPFMVYLLVSFVKWNYSVLIDKTCPEIVLYVTGIGIVTSIFIDAFVIISATFWLMEKEKK